MKSFTKNKKGSLMDIIFIGIVLFFFSIVVLIGFKITDSFNAQIQAMPDMPTEAKVSTNQLESYYSGIIDNSFLFLTIGMAIVTLILATLVRIHPIFIPIYFIGLIIVIIMCGMWSNMYQEMAASAQLSTLATQLVMTSNIMTYLPFIIGIFGIFLMVIMYKTRKENE